MPPVEVECVYCHVSFWASRKDTLYCSKTCKKAVYREECNFQFPVMPKSEVKYIYFNKLGKNWIVQYKRKYYASYKNLEDAKKRLAEIVGNLTS